MDRTNELLSILRILCPEKDSIINNDSVNDVSSFQWLQLCMKTAVKVIENEKIVDRIAKL